MEKRTVNRLLTLILPTLLCLALASCKETIQMPPRNSAQADFDEEFKETFKITVDKSHTFNMANDATLIVKTDKPVADAGIYVYLCNRWYLLNRADIMPESTVVRYDVPINVTDILVVARDMAYKAKVDSSVDISGPGEEVPEGIAEAEPLGWIMAVEYGDRGLDYDFNDMVIRFEPQPGGAMKVTSLACGTTLKMYLHYTDGAYDFVVSPDADNGYMCYSDFIESNVAYEYEYHNWFSDDNIDVRSGNTVNVLGGYNNRPGRSVTIPADFFAGGAPSISLISEMEQCKSPEDVVYLKPKKSFFITAKQYDITMMTYEEQANLIIGSWPAGHAPVVLVFPDINEVDTAESRVGWQWTTDMSRIDMVYTEFTRWMTDPYLDWYKDKPMGWTDRIGETNEKGEYVYFGYYPRKR